MDLASMLDGINVGMQYMLPVSEKSLSGGGTILMILTLTLGGLLGEWIDIESKFERFGEWLKKKTGSQKDNRFIHGFVTSSLTVCIGAMAIVGSIQDGVEIIRFLLRKASLTLSLSW